MIKFNITSNILKILRRFASDSTRTPIHGVRIEVGKEKTTYIATDARRLVTFIQGHASAITAEFTMPSPFIDLLPDEEMITVLYGPDTKLIEVRTRAGNLSVAALDQAYPHWEVVIPKPWPKDFENRNIALNYKYLIDICEAGAVLGQGEGIVITAGAHSTDPYCFRRGPFSAVLMPIRPEPTDLEPPKFEL